MGLEFLPGWQVQCLRIPSSPRGEECGDGEAQQEENRAEAFEPVQDFLRPFALERGSNGVGVNVGQGSGDFDVELAGRATSVYQVMGKVVDRLRVVVGVVEALETRLGRSGRDGWNTGREGAGCWGAR